jgi:antitoxin (DNA-binding transcriptional repressor) of toxin-antitoxin stability system
LAHLRSERTFVLGPNQKGDIAEAEIAAAASRVGCTVARPLTDHPAYDLIIEVGDRLLRVQCKWAGLKDGIVQIRLRRCAHSPTRGYVRGGYDPDEIDAVAAYCDELRECFLLPIELAAGQEWLSLRVDAPRNGQRASIHFAADHTLHGAIAQLGERVHGMHEVAGSSPAGSTSHSEPASEIPVGANRFRRYFGYWMERAAAGDEILITRRGRRYARLGPPDPQLAPENTAPDPTEPADPISSRA